MRCCPEGMVCDIDDDGVFDADDTHYIEQILLGERLYEICGDGIDNNCDGIVDCEEHGAAPLIAQTASTPKQKTL